VTKIKDMGKNIFKYCIILMMTTICSFPSTAKSNELPDLKAASADTFTVTLVPEENGSYTIEPKIPADGRVAAGMVLTVKAKPSSGFRLDAIYYTVRGGKWGTTSYENFSSPMKITVDKDMSVGAIFVESKLVENTNETQDVVYAKPGVKPLKYDVFSPKGAKNLPIIVNIHGGGWSSYTEDNSRALARELVKGGRYVVFNIDYRWMDNADGDKEPNQMHNLIEDVFGAIAHIQEHASHYGADRNKIAVTGESAGGHLAAAAALLSTLIGEGGFGKREGVYQYRPSYVPKGKTLEQVRREITSAVKAAAPSYGVFDARDFEPLVKGKKQEYWNAVSPVKHVPNVKERSIPHFMVRGTRDQIVRDEMVQPYVDVLKANGQQVEYIQIEGVGHGFFNWIPDSRTRSTFAKYGVKYADAMRRFFDSVFYKS
jgi:acetyl esterase